MPHRIPSAIVTAAVVAFLAIDLAAQARWTKAAPFPEPDEELYGVAVNGKMYVLGGFGAGKARGTVYEYDPATNAWTKKQPMARPVHHQAMVAANGKIYVFGGFVYPASGNGWEPVDNAWEYDPAADTWKALPPLPARRGSALAFEVGGKFYVIGGASTHPGSKELAITGTGPARAVDANEMFDLATGRWESRQPLPTARNHAFGGVVNGKIYVIGGRTGHGFITAATNTDLVEEYDPVADTWGALKARMPTARSGGGWGTYNGKIYVAGGEVANAQLVAAFRAVEAYDPAANAWTTLPSMPIPRHGVAGAVMGNRFHLVSGMITSAAAGAGQDAHIEIHTSSHDVIELR